jgi:acyl-coenzyme A thioesterase PaaI-like protein
MELKMTAQQVEELIHLGFGAKSPWLKVEEAEPGRVRTRLLYRDSMLRPGRVLSGPALFTAGDLGMYALVLSHIGPELMAVTANFNINFLNKGKPGDIMSEGRILKLGRKLAVMEVLLYSAAEPETLVAQVSGSYSLPTPKA